MSNMFILNLYTTLALGSVLLGVYWWLRKPRGLPPGPRWTLPIVGDLLSIYDKSDNKDIRFLFKRLRNKYGDLLSVYLGGQLFIVISGWPNVKDALVTNGDIFLDRPKTESNRVFRKNKVIDNMFNPGTTLLNENFVQHFSWNLSDFFLDILCILASTGQNWKVQRKFTVETLNKFGFGRTIIEDKVHEEIEEMIAVLVKENGQPYDMNKLLKRSVGNVIANIICGRRFENGNLIFLKYMAMLDEAFPALANNSLLNLFPYLRYIPGDPFGIQKTVDQINSTEKATFEPIINEHYTSYDENNTDDFISSYIKQIKKEETTGIKSSIDDINLLKTISDLFVAGVDSTSSTLKWCILYFLHYPDVYQKCCKEVQDVIGSERLPSMKDKPNMPYMDAFIMEIQRKVNITGPGPIRSVVRDAIYQGYYVPKGTLVIINAESVLESDDVWGDADVFRPERFIDDNGQIIKREEMQLIFSLGKRKCIAEPMAKIELFLFLTTLVQRFDFQPVDHNSLPPLEGVMGLGHLPVPYQVKAIPRT